MSDDTNNDFSTALEDALAQGDAYQVAHDAVARLVGEVSRGVADKLSGVTVRLLPRGALKIGKFTESLSAGALSGMLNPRPRRIGDDIEDQQARLSVVGSGGNEHRILWELEFHEGGFPITVLGPTPGDSQYCSDEEELRQAFVRAIGSGIVGRKLQVLADLAPEQLSPEEYSSTQTVEDASELDDAGESKEPGQWYPVP